MIMSDECAEVSIRYLLAHDQCRDARQALAHSVTVTQRESAATWHRRAEAHAAYCKSELLSHCQQHSCPFARLSPELAEVLCAAALSVATAADSAAA